MNVTREQRHLIQDLVDTGNLSTLSQWHAESAGNPSEWRLRQLIRTGIACIGRNQGLRAAMEEQSA